MAHAQSAANAKPAEAKPEFQVASIKLSTLPNGGGAIRPGPQGGPGTADPGRVTYSFSTIADLIASAYSVKRYQILGPKWLDAERFDIVAKVPQGAIKQQLNIMLQNLLAERFHLTLHRETKELPVYALVVGAKGPKLKPSNIAGTPFASDSPPKENERGETAAASPPPLRPGLRGMKLGQDGCPETPPMGGNRAGSFMMMTPNGECILSNAQTMDGLAAQLSNGFDRPVIDQTGLSGKYDFKLRYDPSSMTGGRGGPKDALDPAPAGGDASNRADPPPGIFNAIQEQLGLKLEARKGPVELLVIDRVDKRPAAN